MTCALVTQLLNALEYHQSQTRPIHNTELAVEAAREYLATEPIGERAELIERLRDRRAFGMNMHGFDIRLLHEAADMLEADAQPKQVTCQIYGHVVGACVECNTHIEAQQATPDIKALQSNGKGPAPCARFCEANAFEIEIRRLKAEINAQQVKRVPMAGEEIEKIADGCRAVAGSVWPHAFARAIEAHHGITTADKPIDWSAA